MLSTKSLNKIADVIAPEIADYIGESDYFFDTMCELIADGLSVKFGPLDAEVAAEVAMMVSERLRLVALV